MVYEESLYFNPEKPTSKTLKEYPGHVKEYPHKSKYNN